MQAISYITEMKAESTESETEKWSSSVSARLC